VHQCRPTSLDLSHAPPVTSIAKNDLMLKL
jgi:hypothetical protein